MAVRKHASKHDRIGDLPLVTESATVVAAEGMDRDRSAEVRDAVDHWFADEGVTARLDPENVEVYACGINAMVYSLWRPPNRSASRATASTPRGSADRRTGNGFSDTVDTRFV